MSLSLMKNRNKSPEKIPFHIIEDLRKAFNFKICEMADLIGFTTRQYNRCKNNGNIAAYRYYALKNAMLSHILEESQSRIKILSRL